MNPQNWEILSAGGAKSLSSKPLAGMPFDPMPLLQSFVDWRKSADEQKTRRRQIEMEGRIMLERIKMECGLLDKYLQKSFEIREKSLEKLFSILDKALAEKDTRCLEIVVTGIVELVHSNPIPSFQAFQQARAKGEILEL